MTVSGPPFAGDRWTHVAIVFDHVNAVDETTASVELFLNAVPQGRIIRPLPLNWEIDRTAIMLGLSYIGEIDELAVFTSAFSAEQIQRLYALPTGIAGLVGNR